MVARQALTYEDARIMASSAADPAVSWLLDSAEPGIRYLARLELLREASTSTDMVALSDHTEGGPKVRALLDFEDVHPYRKWRGSHWRLVSLVELGLPAGHPGAQAECERVLDYWAVERRRSPAPVIRGRARRCASQEGNALAVACRLGIADDPRARLMAERLRAWQWPDGGWNCDERAASRSSFHETPAPTWGLVEHHLATGEPRSGEAARRAAELFLTHRFYFATRTGEPIHPSFAVFHWPPYWHYDALQALRVLARGGLLPDPRAEDALALVRAKRRPDGHWRAGRRWWRPPDPGGHRNGAEAVDWDATAHEMVTLNALRALQAGSGT